MTFSSCLIESASTLVLDSSVVINILATGHSNAIFRALAIPLIVSDSVLSEIERGEASGRRELSLLKNAIGDQVIEVVKLSGDTLKTFFDLVSGGTVDSLGDGEAATLALANQNRCFAAIDEKKATRIRSERFPMLQLVTTVDILACKVVRESLGDMLLADATFQALQQARMQVREHQFGWVAQLIGPERVSACPSLRKHARRKT